MKSSLVRFSFTFILLFAGCSSNKEPTVEQKAEVQLKDSPAYKDYSTDADTAIRIEVEKRLKAPSSADFPWGDALPNEVTTKGVNLSKINPAMRKIIKEFRRQNKEGAIRVYQKSSYVEAQNSFGAKIRQQYLGTFIINTESGNTTSFVEFY
jgi:PBP1b-binding outer membrane lipoprotein LpoB